MIDRPPYPPVEPPVPAVPVPDPSDLGDSDLVAVSRTLSPGLVLSAYRRGVFPWPVSSRTIPWVSPQIRAIRPLDAAPEWSRSLRKTLRRGAFTVTFDRAFRNVMHACADQRPDATWITPEVHRTYSTLHDLGWTHSVEVWDADGTLAGGLYGIAIGSAFAGESMFHRQTDASKVAFVALVERLRAAGFTLLDAQVPTEHLMSLGCVEMPRREFLDRLAAARAHEARFDAGL